MSQVFNNNPTVKITNISRRPRRSRRRRGRRAGRRHFHGSRSSSGDRKGDRKHSHSHSRSRSRERRRSESKPVKVYPVKYIGAKTFGYRIGLMTLSQSGLKMTDSDDRYVLDADWSDVEFSTDIIYLRVSHIGHEVTIKSPCLEEIIQFFHSFT